MIRVMVMNDTGRMTITVMNGMGIKTVIEKASGRKGRDRKKPEIYAARATTLEWFPCGGALGSAVRLVMVLVWIAASWRGS